MAALSLKDSRVIADLADFLYGFLPGSGNPSWKGHVSFKTVAEEVGVGDFWRPGSKLPMITALLGYTFEYRRTLFEKLILEIVRSGIPYRQKNGNPITPNDIDKLNGLILEIGFKFPELWDKTFQDSLRLEGGQRAKERIEQAIKEDKLKTTAQSKRSEQLFQLKNKFLELSIKEDRQQAGLMFEAVLDRLFDLYDLSPRKSFRVVGEQIDGSFDLDNETYLVEAKWTKEPVPESDLLTFRGKIEGKSAYTRGVFISINGVSREAKEAIVRGKQPTFFIVTGHDLSMILFSEVDLINFLCQRRRLLAEEGLMVVPYSDLWKNSRLR